MSKNIIIQEGGVGKQMTVSKIKVNNVGGGTSLWVPEDSTTLVTKSISKNGMYEASSDNAYGYSEVTVNVAGGKGSATSSGAPTTSNGVDPGGIGSSVVGTNPTTGNEEAVGVDSGGNLVTTSLPSSIVLTVNPTKMSYQDGETIDITGATVTAKKADGSTWTNSQYPNGHIPLGELIVNPTIASGSSGASVSITLTWKRPGDNKALSTSYAITIGVPDVPYVDGKWQYSGNIYCHALGYNGAAGREGLHVVYTAPSVNKVAAYTYETGRPLDGYRDESCTLPAIYLMIMYKDGAGNIHTGRPAPDGFTGYSSSHGGEGYYMPIVWCDPLCFANGLWYHCNYVNESNVPIFNTEAEARAYLMDENYEPGSGYSDDSGGSESGGGGNF